MAVATLVVAASAQTLQLEDYFAPSSPLSNELFGSSLDLEGDTAIVGAPGAYSGGGVVYVESRTALDWIDVARFNAPVFQQQSAFGTAVALSGSWLVVGHPLVDAAFTAQGLAYIYRRTGPTWSYFATLTAADAAASDRFGTAVAIDGAMLFVGAPAHGGGCVYVYEWDGTTWKTNGKLQASDAAAQDWFGVSVAVDGDVCVVGAHQNDQLGNNAGAAYVFRCSGGAWSQRQKLVAGDLGDGFGSSVDVDGSTLVVGAYLAGPGAGGGSGKAYVFAEQGGTWLQQATLDPWGGSGDSVGTQVALVGDLAAVGGPYYTASNSHRGTVHVYRRGGATWSPSQLLAMPATGGTTNLGMAVALDGTTLIAGAPHGTNSGSGAYGMVRSWRTQPFVDAYCTAKTNSAGCQPVLTVVGVPQLSGTAPCTFAANSILPGQNGIFVYGRTGPLASLFQGGYLCTQPPLMRTAMQNSGGTGACDGTFALDFNAWIRAGHDSGLVAGVHFWGQYWSRDPGFAPPNNTNLSSALCGTVWP